MLHQKVKNAFSDFTTVIVRNFEPDCRLKIKLKKIIHHFQARKRENEEKRDNLNINHDKYKICNNLPC